MNLQRQSKRRSSRSSSVIDANQAASSSKKTPQVSSGRLPQCRRCFASPNLMTAQGSGTGTSLLIHRIGGTLTRPGGSATRTARQDSGLTLPADQSRQNSEFYWEAGLLAQPTRSSKDLPPQNSSPQAPERGQTSSTIGVLIKARCLVPGTVRLFLLGGDMEGPTSPFAWWPGLSCANVSLTKSRLTSAES